MPSPAAAAAEDAAYLARNAVDRLPEGALVEKLSEARRAGRPLRVKLGIDPTAPDIHLGHAVVLGKLREFQDLGHRVVLIIGDYTARVGDPSGLSATRPILSDEEIEANTRTFQEQAFRILDPHPDRVEVRRNGEWLDMPTVDLFRLIRTTTVAQVLDREDFARRMATAQPISLLELVYPLLQGYDSVMVRADLELGGTDQTFNLLLAREIQRAYGQPEQAILTMPLLVGTDGHHKMSKSLGNHIAITDPPEQIYGRAMSIPDEAMGDYYRLLLGTAPPEIPPRDAKRQLARALVARLYDEASAGAAERSFDRVFVQRDLPEEMEDHHFECANGVVHMPAVIAEAFGLSRSESRRLIDQGAVVLGERPLKAGERDVECERADGQVLRVGRRRFRRLHRR